MINTELHNSKPLVTVFTPTFNRAGYLRRLYDSLLAQSSYNFEWLVIDDGSSDGTDDLIREFKGAPFAVRYYFYENGGLNRAINRGLDHTETELFLKLDSDDYLLPNAIEAIEREYPRIKDNDKVCALVFRIVDAKGKPIGENTFSEDTFCSFFENTFKYGNTGDRIEVVKSAIHKKCRALEIEGEKYAPDLYFFCAMSEKYKALYVASPPIYVREYLEGGMTKTSYFETIKKNPKGHLLCFAQILNMGPDFRSYLNFSVSYFRFRRFGGYSLVESVKLLPFKAVLFGLLLGEIRSFIDVITAR